LKSILRQVLLQELEEVTLLQIRIILLGAFIFIFSACTLSSLPSLADLTQPDQAEPEMVETEVATESDAQLEEIQVSQAALPTLAVAPTALPPEAIAEADAEELLLINLYERVNPSVVNIVVTVDEASELGADQLFPAQGQGSGFIYDTAGHIITNNHVVVEANKLEVTFFDGTTVEAKVVGIDSDTDLAVIKVEVAPASLRPVTWGDSDNVLVGQRAVAIGNPFGLEGTLTSGIISALGRSLPTEEGAFRIPEIIQTDAAINPGNSGGPLLNSHGEVIGINTAIVPRQSGFGERSFLGVGFAVPANLVKRVVPSLIENGEYQHPWIGFSGNSVTAEIANAMNLPEIKGALVAEVISGSPADKAGLRGGTREVKGVNTLLGGDVIIALDDEEISDFDDLISFLSRRGTVGESVAVTIIRDNKTQTVELTLEARPKADELN
jgi:2-alkenal reductase